eukprot:8633662-Pyramimonas_sp.AAC.2
MLSVLCTELGLLGGYRARTHRNRFGDIRRVRLPNTEIGKRCYSERCCGFPALSSGCRRAAGL